MAKAASDHAKQISTVALSLAAISCFPVLGQQSPQIDFASVGRGAPVLVENRGPHRLVFDLLERRARGGEELSRHRRHAAPAFIARIPY